MESKGGGALIAFGSEFQRVGAVMEKALFPLVWWLVMVGGWLRGWHQQT